MEMTCPHCNADLTEWVKRLLEQEDMRGHLRYLDERDRIARYAQEEESIDRYLKEHPDERERILRSMNEHRDERDRTQEQNNDEP